MNNEYFVIDRAGNNSHPLLEWDERSIDFNRGVPVANGRTVRLKLGDPVPRAPVMVDYHSLPDPVVSAKIRDVLAALRLHKVQLIPANVKAKDKVHDYTLVHIYNEIAAVDRVASDADYSPMGSLLDVRRLVLSVAVLSRIPLAERLVFILAESTSTELFHQSVRDAVMATNPVGVRFHPIASWNSNSSFAK